MVARNLHDRIFLFFVRNRRFEFANSHSFLVCYSYGTILEQHDDPLAVACHCCWRGRLGEVQSPWSCEEKQQKKEIGGGRQQLEFLEFAFSFCLWTKFESFLSFNHTCIIFLINQKDSSIETHRNNLLFSKSKLCDWCVCKTCQFCWHLNVIFILPNCLIMCVNTK